MKISKTTNTNLIKSLIESDFLFIEKKRKGKIYRFENFCSPFLNSRSISFLEPFEILKGLKQIIRVFNFATKNTKSKTGLHFFLEEDNALVFQLLKKYLNNELMNSKTYFDIKFETSNLKTLKKKKDFQINFILDKNSLNDRNFIKKQFHKNNFLFFKIHSTIDKTQNSYKIQNNFGDYKKILFFIGFLRQIISKSYLIKKNDKSKTKI